MKTDKIPNYLWSKIEVLTQLRNIMFQRGITQTKWSEKADVANSHLTNILNGKTLPRLDSLIQLADAVNCRVTIRIEPKTSNDNERFQDLAKAYWQGDFVDKLTPEERKVLLQHYMLASEDERIAA